MSFLSYLPNPLHVNALSLRPKTDRFSLEYQSTEFTPKLMTRDQHLVIYRTELE